MPFHLVKLKEFVQKCKSPSPPCKEFVQKCKSGRKTSSLFEKNTKLQPTCDFAHPQRIYVKKLISIIWGKTTKSPSPQLFGEKNTPKTSPLQPTCDVSAHLKPRLPRTSINQSSTWLFKVLKKGNQADRMKLPIDSILGVQARY